MCFDMCRCIVICIYIYIYLCISFSATVAGSPIVDDGHGRPALFGVFVGTQGDLKEKVAQCMYVRNYNANFLCEHCMATRHQLHTNAYDFGPQASWMFTLIAHAYYVAMQTNKSISPWVKLRSWSILRWMWDLLHLIWLGFGKDLIGTELIIQAKERRTPDLSINDCLMALYNEYVHWCKVYGRSYSSFPWSMQALGVTSGLAYPELHSYVKGAHTKQFSYV